MEEAQRLCDRIGILDEGRLVAEGAHRDLVALVGEQDHVELSATGDLAETAKRLGALDGVEQATVVDSGIELVVRGARRLLPQMLEVAAKAGAEVSGVVVAEPDLEAVFLHLTGKRLRD
jgi:ABC-2 type transport system ATP-binding protein